jgi:hypothetical protein
VEGLVELKMWCFKREREMRGFDCGRNVVGILIVCFLLAPCALKTSTEDRALDERATGLMEAFASLREDSERIAALEELTSAELRWRFEAIKRLVERSREDVEILPKRSSPLFAHLVRADYLPAGQEGSLDKYTYERRLHVRSLSVLQGTLREYRMYGEIAELLYWKALYGFLWARECSDRYDDREGFDEFSQFKNAGVSELRLLLRLVSSKDLKIVIIQFLGKLGQRFYIARLADNFQEMAATEDDTDIKENLVEAKQKLLKTRP